MISYSLLPLATTFAAHRFLKSPAYARQAETQGSEIKLGAKADYCGVSPVPDVGCKGQEFPLFFLTACS